MIQKQVQMMGFDLLSLAGTVARPYNRKKAHKEEVYKEVREEIVQ